MNADTAQTMFEDACLRLFALHANGYRRPKPSLRVATTRPAVTTSVRPGQRPRQVQTLI